MKLPYILVLDDDESMSFFLKEAIEREGYICEIAYRGSQAIELIQNKRFDAIIIDLKLPDIDGLELIPLIKKYDDKVPIIMITAYGSIQTARDAIKLGAWDYFTKPFDLDELRIVLKRSLEKSKLEEQIKKMYEKIEKGYEFEMVIGTSGKMQEVFSIVKKVISSDVTIMLYGESGTGKELIASVIHYNSHRASGPFIKMNCAAIPESLLESELFGYEKGAFTGADTQKIGKFEQAHGGTLFLDEVADMSLSTQAKLLRTLELKEFERLGGKETIKVDIRIISATNQNLFKAVQEKKFREDLFYRLNVVPINLPPLRERKADIPLLIEHFIKIFNTKLNKNIKKISPEVNDILLSYNWPGNVRELENVIQRAMVLTDGDTLKKDSLPLNLQSLELDKISSAIHLGEEPSLPEIVEEIAQRVEKDLIYKALEQTGWSRTETAKLLKICRKSLHNKMKKYNIIRE